MAGDGTGMGGSVSTEPHVLTLAEAVRLAPDPPLFPPARRVRSPPAASAPEGGDELIADFRLRFEDRDEPITAIADGIEDLMAEATRSLDVEEDDPALTMAGAVVTYLAFRRDNAEEAPERLLQLAADAEFD